MKVSVVTISFNQAEFLDRAMTSVLSQEGVDLEYIVVDAGSTDGSREIIQTYADRLAHVIFEPDDGPADGLNAGFRRATGEVCTWVNADDELLPGAVRRVVAEFEDHPYADVMFADGFVTDRNGRRVRRLRSTRGFGARDYVFGRTSVLQQATFVRREPLVRIGFNRANRTNWDGEIFLRLALEGAIFRHVRDDWGCFRIHPKSTTGSERTDAEYYDVRRLMFREVMGREANALDKLQIRLAAPQKWIRDPVGFLLRLFDAIRGSA